MASQFPLFIAHAGSARNEGQVNEMTFLNTDTSQPGDLVFFDTADNNVKKCGANPALILGLSLGYGPAATNITGGGMKVEPYPTNRALVSMLSEDVILGMSSASTPALSFLLRSWDIVNTTISTGAGIRSFWQLAATTGNTRVRVVDIDIANGIFYVSVINANLQSLVT